MAAKLLPEYLDVDGKVILVTGGAVGIGAGLVKELLAQNARVWQILIFIFCKWQSLINQYGKRILCTYLPLLEQIANISIIYTSVPLILNRQGVQKVLLVFFPLSEKNGYITQHWNCTCKYLFCFVLLEGYWKKFRTPFRKLIISRFCRSRCRKTS